MRIGTRQLRAPQIGLPSAPQPQGRLWRAFKSVLPLIIIGALVYLFYNFPAIWDRVRYGIHHPKPGTTAHFPATLKSPDSAIPIGGTQECGVHPVDYDSAGNPKLICDDYVYIPRIRIAAPIVFTKSTNENDIDADLLKGVVHYPGTADPGQNGNIFLTGHSSFYWWVPTEYRNVFTLEPQLNPGDEIVIYHKGIRFSYRVYGTLEVAPNETSVLRATSDPELTLSTCVPIGTSYHRKIVKAKQTSPDPALNSAGNGQDVSAGRLPGVR